MSVGVSVKARGKMTKTQKKLPKPTKKTLIIAQEIKLAKILAGNNKTLRDRTLRKLKKWFDAREMQMPFTEDDFMRLWKGLFFYMWMSDKPLIQEECAENIAKLLHFKKTETSILFFKCFLQTMVHEWFGIDNLRLDKFLMLVRRVLRQSLNVLISDSNENCYKLFQNALSDTVLQTIKKVPLSLTMHLVEIFLEEVAKVSKGDLAADNVLELLRPFADLLAKTDDHRLREHIKDHIFQYLLKQSDEGLEYEERFNSWRQAGFPGGSIDVMEKIEISKDEDNDINDTADGPLDPRAGKIHVELPQIKFDPMAVADMLDELKYHQQTRIKSRKNLESIANLFRRLGKGDYPLGMKRIKIESPLKQDKTNVKRALKRLRDFDDELMGDSKKSKSRKRRAKKLKDIVAEELEKYKTLPEEKPSQSIEEFIAKSEQGIFDTNTMENGVAESKVEKKIKTLKIKPKKPKELKKSKQLSKQCFERNSGVWEVEDLESVEDTTEIVIEKPEKHKKKIKKLSTIPEMLEMDTQKISIEYKKIKKNKIRNKIPSTSDSLVKNPFSTPSSEKKVKIALDLNRSQDHREYHKSLVDSPGIPFDAHRKPVKPLLKKRPGFINNINPFYKKKINF